MVDRGLAGLVLTLLMVSGCSFPSINVSERSVGLIASNDEDAEVLRPDCPTGSSRLFPGDDAYVLGPNQAEINLLFEIKDVYAITDAEIAMPRYSGTFVEPGDLPVEILDIFGAATTTEVWRYDAPIVANTRNIIFPMTVAPSAATSGGAVIRVKARNQFFRGEPLTFSMRLASVECQADL
ncbi:MAG: hypothetical protein AAGD04_13675 [Pseudomonadota bacterium]